MYLIVEQKAPTGKIEIFDGVLCLVLWPTLSFRTFSSKRSFPKKNWTPDFISKVPEKRNVEISDIKNQ